MRLPALLILCALAGCLDAAPAALTPLASDAALAVGETAYAPGEPHRWNGSGLEGAAPSFERFARDYGCWAGATCGADLLSCEERDCARTPFSVGPGAGALTLTVRWPTLPGVAFDAWIEDAGGDLVARAAHRAPIAVGAVALLDAPAPGEYVAVVAARDGSAAWEAALLVEPATQDSAPRALLPNLVTLPPTDLSLETPTYAGASYFAFPVPGVREATEAAGAKGCRIDEAAEYRDARCLRFSNAVGNIGEGPLDVRLAAGSLAFVQRVHKSDGTFEEHAGGAAEWHATHAHWHNAASNRFSVHAYDPDSRTRGEAVHEGKKGGICFADVGLVDVGLPRTLPPTQSGWGCLQPSADAKREWAMGLTPGWYDLYAYVLSDQYVDVTGLPDGTYALCSVTNGEGTLAESDLGDNEACTPFRLAGDEVELLEPAPYHAIPESERI